MSRWGRGDQGWSIGRDTARRLADRSLHVTIQGYAEILPGGVIRNRTKTAYNAGTGVYLGMPTEDGVAVFGVGDSTNYLTWDGTTLTVNPNLSALNADLGTITAGTINMFTGTWDTDATGFRLNATEIAGQNAGTDQVIIAASDGKLKSGQGQAILSRTGIELLHDAVLGGIGYGIGGYGKQGYGGLVIPAFTFTSSQSTKAHTIMRTLQDELAIAYSTNNGSDGYPTRWIFDSSGSLQLPTMTAAPATPATGMFAWADGTNWDPGAGAGPYVYNGAAWRKLIGYGN